MDLDWKLSFLLGVMEYFAQNMELLVIAAGACDDKRNVLVVEWS